MKKSQSSLFIIVGLIIIILIGIYAFSISKNNGEAFEQENNLVFTQANLRTEVNNFIDSCIEYSVEEVIQETGIREETLPQYKDLVSLKTKECSDSLLIQLRDQNYVVHEEKISLDIELNEETIVVNVDYPINIEKDNNKVMFENFHYTFGKTSSVEVPNGVAKSEIRLKSPDGIAEIRIPEGTEIIDKNGNPVEELGIKLYDRQFNGLENKYMIGEVVYETFPDGATFSSPIEILIEFDEDNIPEGYTKNNLAIGYWDEETNLWKTTDTIVKDNIAVANITHFSMWQIFFEDWFLIEVTVFEKRFNPTSTEFWKVDTRRGSAALIPNVDEFRGEEDFEDFRETFDILESDYLSPPTIEYGYFEDPEDFSSRFIKCYPEVEDSTSSDYFTFKMGKDGFPEYKLKTVLSAQNCRCSDCEETLYPDKCNSISCGGQAVGVQIGESRCINLEYPDVTPSSTPSPTPMPSPTPSPTPTSSPGDECVVDCSLETLSPIDGMHSTLCAGGRVKPGDKGLVSFIGFTPGDVIHEKFSLFGTGELKLYVGCYPPSNNIDLDPLDLRTILFDALSRKKASIRDYPFTCSIETDEGTDQGGKFSQKEIIRDTITKNGVTYTIYGIQKVNVVRNDVDYPEAQVHARGDVYWWYKGNDPEELITNTPFTIVEGSQVTPLSEVKEWNELLIPDEVNRGIITLEEWLEENPDQRYIYDTLDFLGIVDLG